MLNNSYPAMMISGSKYHISSTLWLLLIAMFSLAACSNQPSTTISPEQNVALPVTELQSPLQNGDKLLDIGVLVFNSGVIEASVDQEPQALLEIRRTETQYLPFALRNTLVESNQWGAVRVLPNADPSVDLLVSGTILQSDGNILQLQITAQDSSGRQWLNKQYTDFSEGRDFPRLTARQITQKQDSRPQLDPFQDLYKQIANDLLIAKQKLSQKQIRNINQISLLQYAKDLSPESFDQHLGNAEDGSVFVNRLPANNDPMFDRVISLRQHHYLYIDALDEHYSELFNEMQPTYYRWRQYSRDQIRQLQRRDQRTEQQGRQRIGNFNDMQRSYERYKWSKIYEQEFAELAEAFNRELAPAVLGLNQHVIKLNGTAEDQYLQWRTVLRKIFSIETGQLSERNNGDNNGDGGI